MKYTIRHPRSVDGRTCFIERLACRGSERTPVFPRDLTLGMDLLGIGCDRMFSDGYADLSSKCVIALQKELGHDATTGCINTYSTEVFGGVMRFPDNGIPYLSSAGFDDLSKMDDHDPFEIYDFAKKGMGASCGIVRSALPDTALVANVAGPVTMAGFLRGIEPLLMDFIINPAEAGKIMSFSEEVSRFTFEAMSASEPDALFLASASDNPDMMGIEDYIGFALPSVKRLTERSHSLGIPVIYHPHGIFSTDDRRRILEESIDTGIDGFQFAEGNEPSGIVECTRGRCAILGGVDATTTLLLGPEDRVRRDARAFMEMLSGEDYIMTCSCSLHRGLPISNVKAMVDAARGYDRGMP